MQVLPDTNTHNRWEDYWYGTVLVTPLLFLMYCWITLTSLSAPSIWIKLFFNAIWNHAHRLLWTWKITVAQNISLNVGETPFNRVHPRRISRQWSHMQSRLQISICKKHIWPVSTSVIKNYVNFLIRIDGIWQSMNEINDNKWVLPRVELVMPFTCVWMFWTVKISNRPFTDWEYGMQHYFHFSHFLL